MGHAFTQEDFGPHLYGPTYPTFVRSVMKVSSFGSVPIQASEPPSHVIMTLYHSMIGHCDPSDWVGGGKTIWKMEVNRKKSSSCNNVNSDFQISVVWPVAVRSSLRCERVIVVVCHI